MKKHVLLFTAALACGLYTQAQQKVSFGLKAGFSAANISMKSNEGGTTQKANNKMLPAFHAGVIADIPFDDQLSLQPGLFFSQKGATLDDMDSVVSSQNIKTTLRLNYLELPVNLVYKHQMGNGKLFAGLGAYAAYGVGGRLKATQGNLSGKASVKFKDKVEINPTLDQVFVKPFDAGANFMLGYELKMGLLFSVNYSLGLVNTTPYEHETHKNSYLGVSVGYLLKK